MFSSSAEESSPDFLENSLPGNFRLESSRHAHTGHAHTGHAHTALPAPHNIAEEVTMTSLGRVPFTALPVPHHDSPHKKSGEVTVTSLSPLHVRGDVGSDPCVGGGARNGVGGRVRDGVGGGVRGGVGALETQSALPQVFRTQLPNSQAKKPAKNQQ